MLARGSNLAVKCRASEPNIHVVRIKVGSSALLGVRLIKDQGPSRKTRGGHEDNVKTNK